ncbi:MAG: flagellar motor switch protein FliM [Lachnospiraceae bacterium]|nr:flagellar motor switch protein FliM [Lachnospiraceae bacterium]MBR1910523.1 flagellar motor switch protein FliM [Lachnospiraceae bacterium]
MGDVLSQAEIDNLLQALSSGEIDADEIKEDAGKNVKEYDFKRPAKFSKEHLRTLEIIFEHYGRLLSTNYPVYLRKNVQVSVVNSEALTFSEFTNSLSNPVILGIVNFLPLNGNIMVELSATIGFAMIDRLLGGQGEPLEKNREFSEIELSLVEKMMTISVGLMREPWRNVVENLNPVLERVETNPQFAQIIAPTEMIAIVTLNIKIGDVEGLMNVCLPYFTLESIMEKLNTKFWFSTMQDTSDENYVEHMEDLIKHVQIPIMAILGESSITVTDFVNLQVGDIIRLDSRVAQDMDVYVGNIRKFKALPGSTKDSYAVRVTEVIREEE